MVEKDLHRDETEGQSMGRITGAAGDGGLESSRTFNFTGLSEDIDDLAAREIEVQQNPTG